MVTQRGKQEQGMAQGQMSHVKSVIDELGRPPTRFEKDLLDLEDGKFDAEKVELVMNKLYGMDLGKHLQMAGGLLQQEGALPQDDYDVEELDADDSFLYESGPTHHIEVELSDGPPGRTTHDSEEPLCEFTFEYDRNGKLIPTSNNIEEKLRLLSLQAKMSMDSRSIGPKKKKKNTKKKLLTADNDTLLRGAWESSLCLFCQYEAVFGRKPTNSLDWLEHNGRSLEKGLGRGECTGKRCYDAVRESLRDEGAS